MSDSNDTPSGAAHEWAIDSFLESHPHLHPDLLEHARSAFAHYHVSPAAIDVLRGTEATVSEIHFGLPDPRMALTYERPRCVEFGAVLMAALLLARFEGKVITRVAPRGDRFDYFVGEGPDDDGWILEVGGTDEGAIGSLRLQKRRQLEASPYRGAPFFKDGFVGATRFAPGASTALDRVPTTGEIGNARG